MAKRIPARDAVQKELIGIFDKLCTRHQRWQAWTDFVTIAACDISCAVDKASAKRREALRSDSAGRYSENELQLMAELFAGIINSMEQNPNQDCLGDLFMRLDLGNQYKGQFFTPYSVCACMAKMNTPIVRDMLAEKNWIAVNDPACGAGALLIAFANECRAQGVNYQTSVLFCAQDIDFIAGCMCYIQLSLLGCAGYVVIADTLANPATCIDSRGLIPVPGENVWYTPMYLRQEWCWRRAFAAAEMSFQNMEHTEPEHTQEPAQKQKKEPMKLHEAKHGQLSFF